MSIKSIVEQISGQGEEYTSNLTNVQTLPHYFDSFLVGYNQDSPSKIKALIDEVAKTLKELVKKAQFNKDELIIEISFLTYLILYRIPDQINHLSIDHKKLSMLIAFLLTSFKNKDLSHQSMGVIIGCLSALCSYEISSLEYAYDAIYSYINTSDFEIQKMFIGIFSSITQIPFLLGIVQKKKHTSNIFIIAFINTLILSLISKNSSEIQPTLSVSIYDMEIVENFCSSISNQKEPAFQEIRALLLFLFIRHHSDILTIHDYIMFIKIIPQFFSQTATDNQVEHLASILVTVIQNNDIEESQHHDFEQLILIVLNNRPSSFIEIFNSLKSNENFEWCISELIKEIFKQKSILLTGYENPKSVETNPDDTNLKNDDDYEHTKSDDSRQEDEELEDLDKSEKQPKNDIRMQIVKLVVETSLQFIFSNRSIELQLGVFEGICSSPEIFDSVVNNSIELFKNGCLEEEYNKEANLDIFNIIDYLAEHLLSLSKEYLQYKYTIHSFIPDFVALLINKRPIDQSEEDDHGNKVHIYNSLKFLALISLTDREENDSTLKALGYETENLEEAFLSFSALSDSYLWKSEVQDIMYKCFATLISVLKEPNELPDKDLIYKGLKFTFIGCIALNPIWKIESFITLISLISDPKAIDVISEAFRYINISDISETASRMFCKLLDPRETEEMAKIGIGSLIISLLKNRNWNKERIINADLSVYVNNINQLLSTENEFSNLYIKILIQMLIADNDEGIDIFLKGKAIRLILENLELTESLHSDVIKAIAITYKPIQLKSTKSTKFIDKIDELVLVPHIFSFIEKNISEDKTENEELIEAISSVCSFYGSAFELAFQKLKSSNQMIVDTYSCALIRFLERSSLLSLNNSFSILDFFMMNKNIIANGISNIGFNDVICEHIYSPKIAEELICKLIQIHFDVFEENKPNEKLENITTLKGSKYTDQIISHYLREISNQWTDNYYEINSSICQKINESENNENITELVRTFIDQFNEFVDIFPSVPLKVAYYFSSHAEPDYIKRVFFQGIIIYHIINHKLGHSLNLSVSTLSHLIMNAKAPRRCESYNVQKILHNAKLPPQYKITDEDYLNFLGTIVRTSSLLYEKGKRLYEEEGLSNLLFNKSQPKLDTTALFNKLCSIALGFFSKDSLTEEEKVVIDQYILKLFQFSIEYNHSFPEEWNNNEHLKEVYQSSIFFKQLEADSSYKTKIHTAEEKKWYIVSYIMIAMSSKNNKNNDIYVKLLSLVIKQFGIECKYQIPILDEGFSGRLDSLAFQVSEGMAEYNGNSERLFLQQYFNALKEFDGQYEISSLIVLEPWSIAAGKKKNKEYINDLINAFLDKLPSIVNESKWGKPGSILVDNLLKYSKASMESIHEILAEILARACKHCTPEDEQKVNLISKILVMILMTSDKETNGIYSSLIHSCIIGTSVYDSSSIRSLLRFSLSKLTGFDNEINFLEDLYIKGYDCLLRIAYLLSEKMELLKDNQEYFEKAFFEDAIKAPWDQISITGWLFLSAFTQFDKLPIKDYKVDADYYKFYKTKEQQTEENRKDEYDWEEVEDIINNHTHPYSPIHKLLRLSISNPKEFYDIISLYIRRFNNIKEIKASDTIIEFNGEFDNYSSTIPVCFAFMNSVKFTSFEAKTLSDLSAVDSSDENWDNKALSFFIYLVLSNSDNLSKFIFTLDGEKFVKLLMSISTGFSLNIEDANIDLSPLNDLFNKISEKGILESVVNNLIQNISDKGSVLNSISSEILSLIFNESTIWIQSKKAFPNVLWSIYSIIETQEMTEIFVKPIQEILDWNISNDLTIYISEALIILEQIASKLDVGTIENLATHFNLFNKSEQKIDYNIILDNISQVPPEEIMGAIFVFGKDRISSQNQIPFEKLFSRWIDENKESSPIIGSLFNEQLSFEALNLADNPIPSNFKFDVMSHMIRAETLSDAEAENIIKYANVWIADHSLVQLGKMLVQLMKSKYMDQRNRTSLFLNILFSINEFITKKRTIENIVSTIKEDASKITQIIPPKTNEEIDNLISAIFEGTNIFNDAKDLVELLAIWNVKNQEDVKEIANEINECIDNYNHHLKIVPIIRDVCCSLEAMAMDIKIETPKTLHEEQFTRNIISQVMRLMAITETELPGFNCAATLRILQQLAKAKPNVVIPFIYAYHGAISERMKESISIVESAFIKCNLEPCEPVLAKVLEENNFEKIFNVALSVEELIDIITYLAITRKFDGFFAVANERLMENQDLTEDSLMTKIFTAIFCFLMRPLEFGRGVLESLSERNINDVLHKICLSENFYYYFNRLTVGKDIKKSLFLECVFKQFLKSPDLFRTLPKLTGYTYSTLVFGNLTEIDDFIESISHKKDLCAMFNYNDGAESREKVIRILQKNGHIEPEYNIENEKERQIIDFRICSEFGIFTRIVDNPITCLSLYQRMWRFSDPVVVCINMPSIRYLFNYDRCTLWKFANSIQNKSEAIKLITMLISVYISPKKVRELVSFIIMKYPQAAAKALIENIMDSAFIVNIAEFQVLRKGEDTRDVHTMRCIKLLYQLEQIFSGLTSDWGPKLVANCICSLTISSFRWVKYVRRLIGRYVDHINSDFNDMINEKKEALMKAIDEKERHFDVIIEAAFDLFGAIGEEKQGEFVSIFNSVSIFDFLYLYPAGVSAHIKLCELEAISDERLNVPSEIDKMIKNIVRNFMCYFRNKDGSWTCYLSGIFETIEKLVSLKCSAKLTKLMAWLSVVCIMSDEKNIRLASLSLLHTCISRLKADNEIVDDEFLGSCISTANLISFNETLHQLLTREYNRNFVSIFAVCVSVAFGYGDEETKEAVNGLLKDSWVAWNQQAIASLYILLPMAGYSSLDIKEVTGMDFIPLLDTLTPSLLDVDFKFIRSYIHSAAKDWRCSRERLAILCPNLSFPLKKTKNFDPRKETVKVVMPQPEKSIYYFSMINRAIINACRL